MNKTMNDDPIEGYLQNQGCPAADEESKEAKERPEGEGRDLYPEIPD